MKKLLRYLLSLVLVLIPVFLLASCKDAEVVSLPTTKHEKVQFAFNGVEGSLKSNQNSKGKLNLEKKSKRNDASSNALSTIYSFLKVEEETNNPSFKYDEPPMIQFQYLKALYSEVGHDFSFNIKYSYQINGEVYYDFTNKQATQSSEYLNQYALIVGILIDIDDNDLITAEVSFDVTYTNNNVIHHQKRYSRLILKYDMNEKNPTYELTMYDIDDLLEYSDPNEKYISMEYDYVNVEENLIKECRKFGVCSPDSLTNYQNEDYVYKYSVLRAFKDNKKYFNENSYRKDINLKQAVFTGLGFSNVLDNMDTFLDMQSTENSKIEVVVNKFNSILGKDIVNSFVYTGGTEQWERSGGGDEPENLFIRVISQHGLDTDVTIYNDYKLNSLFNPNSPVSFDQKGGTDYLTIYVKNGEEDLVKTINDLRDSDIVVKVKSTSYNDTKWIDLSNDSKYFEYKFSELLCESGFIDSDYDYKEMTLEVDITLKDDSNVCLQYPFYINLVNDSVYQEVIGKWDLAKDYINKYAIIKDAIPEIKQDGLRYSPKVYDGGLTGRIGLELDNNLADLITNYTYDLKNSLGFVENSYYSTYTKRLTDDYLLVLTVYGPSDKDGSTGAVIYFEFVENKKQEATITDALNDLIDNEQISIPTFDGGYEYSVQENSVRINLNDSSIISSYIQSFGNYGFVVYNYLDTYAAIRYLDGIIYRIRDLGKSIAVEKIEGSVSLVGDFNGWLVDDTSYDFESISVENGRLYLEIKTSIDANTQFKIVKNHSWNDGGYGFGFGDPSEYKQYFGSGNENNFVALRDLNLVIKVEIEADYYSSNPGITIMAILFEVK